MEPCATGVTCERGETLPLVEAALPQQRARASVELSKRALKKRAREERRRVVEEHYDLLGHACDATVHVWHRVFPDGTSEAEIYGAVSAFERLTKRRVDVAHPLPPGFRPGWQVRRDRRFDRYAETWD